MELTAQQLEERKNYTGASEVDDALFNRLPLYIKKTAGHIEEDKDYFVFGNLCESITLDRFEKRIKPIALIRPTESDPLEFSSKTRLMRAHLDSMVKDTAVVEAKHSRDHNGFGEPGSDAVPRRIILQTQAQMYLSHLPMAYIPVLFRDDLRLEVYETHIDEELVAMIAEGVAEFWNYVARREPPPPDFESRGAVEIIRKLYKGTDGRVLTASSDDENYYRMICDAQEKAANYSAIVDNARAHLLWQMGEAAELKFSDGKVLRRKLVSKKGFTVAPTEYVDARFVRGQP